MHFFFVHEDLKEKKVFSSGPVGVHSFFVFLFVLLFSFCLFATENVSATRKKKWKITNYN